CINILLTHPRQPRHSRVPTLIARPTNHDGADAGCYVAQRPTRRNGLPRQGWGVVGPQFVVDTLSSVSFLAIRRGLWEWGRGGQPQWLVYYNERERFRMDLEALAMLQLINGRGTRKKMGCGGDRLYVGLTY
uniref:Uncharacterized protein n=1 Tax=Oryza glaberrima TaxID=4538 RepID=I1PNG4_ORYGL